MGRHPEGWKYVVISARGDWGHLLRYKDGKFARSLRHTHDASEIPNVSEPWQEISEKEAREEIEGAVLDAGWDKDDPEFEKEVNNQLEELTTTIKLRMTDKEAQALLDLLRTRPAIHVYECIVTKLTRELSK
jgi:hypothetical protein